MEYPFQQKLRGQTQLYGDEKFIHYDWDYFAGDYLVFFPKAVPPSVLQAELLRTFRHVHGLPAGRQRDLHYSIAQRLIAYTHRPKERNLERYIDFLAERERGKYDRHGCLVSETLIGDRKPTELGIPGIPVFHPPVAAVASPAAPPSAAELQPL
jgi:hypothetical protein